MAKKLLWHRHLLRAESTTVVVVVAVVVVVPLLYYKSHMRATHSTVFFSRIDRIKPLVHIFDIIHAATPVSSTIVVCTHRVYGRIPVFGRLSVALFRLPFADCRMPKHQSVCVCVCVWYRLWCRRGEPTYTTLHIFSADGCRCRCRRRCVGRWTMMLFLLLPQNEVTFMFSLFRQQNGIRRMTLGGFVFGTACVMDVYSERCKLIRWHAHMVTSQKDTHTHNNITHHSVIQIVQIQKLVLCCALSLWYQRVLIIVNLYVCGNRATSRQDNKSYLDTGNDRYNIGIIEWKHHIHSPCEVNNVSMCVCVHVICEDNYRCAWATYFRELTWCVVCQSNTQFVLEKWVCTDTNNYDGVLLKFLYNFLNCIIRSTFVSESILYRYWYYLVNSAHISLDNSKSYQHDKLLCTNQK